MAQRKVLFVGEHGDSACGFYRLYIPALGMKRSGWMAGTCPSIVTLPDGALTGFDGRNVLPVPDVIVLRRLNEPLPGTMMDSGTFKSMSRTITKAVRRGQQVYIDLDDDPWTLPEWNPAHGNMTQYELDMWIEDMNAATGVICSTDVLAESVAIHTEASVYVCRNGVDPSMFRYRHTPSSPFRLCWMGTTDYRGRDFSTIVPMLTQALQGFLGEVEFWHLGARPGKVGPTSIRALVGADFPVQIVERKWEPILMLPSLLMEADALLIPMEKHPFNRARSNITGLAAAAAGVPFMFPPWHEEYDRLWRMGAGYPFGTTPESLSVMFTKEYEPARADMRIAGIQTARQHDPVQTARQYIEVFNA